jgi:DNA-binding NarL/FixJ family response regulator
MMTAEREAEIESRTVNSSYASNTRSTSINTHDPTEPGRICNESRSSQTTSYWNRDQTGTIFVGLVDEDLFTRECLAGVLRERGALEVMSFANCEECLQCKAHQDVIVYHDRRLKTKDSKDLRFGQLQPLMKTAPVIILSAADCRDSIIEAFEIGARGFIPTGSTPPKQVIEIIRFVNAGGTFVPPSSLSLGRINGEGTSPAAIASCEFTPREMAVLERLTLGKANKNIAHELQMSESTVKVHIRSIMNKLKATNRTEVVCRAYDLGGLGTRSRGEA